MIRLRHGTVNRVLDERPGALELEVEVEGAPARALAYPDLVGPVGPGRPVDDQDHPEVGDVVGEVQRLDVQGVGVLELGLGCGGEIR